MNISYICKYCMHICMYIYEDIIHTQYVSVVKKKKIVKIKMSC